MVQNVSPLQQYTSPKKILPEKSDDQISDHADDENETDFEKFLQPDDSNAATIWNRFDFIENNKWKSQANKKNWNLLCHLLSNEPFEYCIHLFHKMLFQSKNRKLEQTDRKYLIFESLPKCLSQDLFEDFFYFHWPTHMWFGFLYLDSQWNSPSLHIHK